MFPPNLIEPSEYTGLRTVTIGAVGESTLEMADVLVEVEGECSELQVLVQPDRESALLGTDFPSFAKILHRKLDDFLRGQEPEGEQASLPVQAVSTRLQCQQQEEQEKADDRDTAASDAVVFDLDDSLFGVSKEKQKLTKREKRKEAQRRIAAAEETTARRQRLTDLSRQDLEEAQHEDESLQPLWTAAEAVKDGYSIEGGLLEHHCLDEWGEDRSQLVVPRKYRPEVINLAHRAKTSGHLGSKKTSRRILRDFFWPGLSKDVSAYCRTCEECQRGAKGGAAPAPLQPLPTIEEPFQRVAIDIVGPLPRTKKGHKFKLTIMDFATRYPEAIPLKKTDTATVAEALCHVFTRLGLPQEILSDQGTNFTSKLMEKVAELLQITQLKTSPYHPQTNGMIERMHGTLKSLLRKTSASRKEWDDYLPFFCFALRDMENTATGYSSFQLLFGRNVKGPLFLLHHQLTEKTEGGRPTTEYVESLKERLHESWKLATENDSRTKQQVKLKYDEKARRREFQVGDQVLVLSPIATESLEDKWSGPYVVEDKVSDVTYRVRTPDRRKKTRLFHINGMKRWTTPTTVMAVQYCQEELPDLLEPELIPFELPGSGRPTISAHLTEEQRVQLDCLLKENETVFDTHPGHTDVVEHSVDTGDARPVFHPPYRIPPAWQEEVRQEIGDMLDAGIIVPSKSPWTSPLVPIRKKDGGLRLCVDYRKLNQVTKDDRYPMPRVEELVEELGKARFISTIDLVKGYYQVSVKPDDRCKTAFMAPMGKYEFVRMPFGLKGAPSTFQRLMDSLLSQCTAFARSYMDDIVIFSNSWEEHMEHLKKVLDILRKAGLKVKPSKCNFAMQHCSYLGHVVGGGKVAMDVSKTQAIRNYHRPRTKREVRAFLGLAGYYRRFIPDFSTLSAPLSDLTKKDMPKTVKWSDELERCFTTLKALIAKEPVLACPDSSRPFYLQTDASERGLGAVLSQESEDGEHPIAFYSRKLLPRETRYSTIEKECLAVVAALKHFEVHLIGQEFTIVTDHRALKYLQEMKNANPRLTRWALAIQPFTFRVTHRPGVKHGNADGMSRQSWTNVDTNIPSPDDFIAEKGERNVGISPTAAN